MEAKKTVEVSRFVDKAAKSAEGAIERVHGRMARVEEGIGGRVEATSEQLMAKFERRAQALGKYVEANPVKATMFAFGIGILASRMFKGMEFASPETGPGVKAAPAGDSPEPKVGKAA